MQSSTTAAEVSKTLHVLSLSHSQGTFVHCLVSAPRARFRFRLAIHTGISSDPEDQKESLPVVTAIVDQKEYDNF